MSFDSASKQFRENAKLFGSDPEKYNLYNGLYNIIIGLKELKNSIYQIEQRLQHLENKIQ